MLRVVNLTKAYGDVIALRDVTLTFRAGECVGIIGRSGAGKSTLLRCINRMIQPTSGQVFIEGVDVTHLPLRDMRNYRRRIGMIFQHFNLVRRLSVLKNVLSGRLGYYRGLAALRTWVYWFPRTDVEKALQILDRLHILDQAYKKASDLSGGQQQRVGIARALIQEPKIFLADEPVSSVDPRAAEEILYWLRKVCHEDQIVMLINIHNVDLAQRYMDRIIGIAEGRVVFDGRPEELTPEILQRVYGVAEHQRQGQGQGGAVPGQSGAIAGRSGDAEPAAGAAGQQGQGLPDQEGER